MGKGVVARHNIPGRGTTKWIPLLVQPDVQRTGPLSTYFPQRRRYALPGAHPYLAALRLAHLTARTRERARGRGDKRADAGRRRRCGPPIQTQTRSRDEIQEPAMRVIRPLLVSPKPPCKTSKRACQSRGTCSSRTNVTLFLLNRNRCAHVRAAFLAWIFMPHQWASRPGSTRSLGRSLFRIIVMIRRPIHAQTSRNPARAPPQSTLVLFSFLSVTAVKKASMPRMLGPRWKNLEIAYYTAAFLPETTSRSTRNHELLARERPKLRKGTRHFAVSQGFCPRPSRMEDMFCSAAGPVAPPCPRPSVRDGPDYELASRLLCELALTTFGCAVGRVFLLTSAWRILDQV